MAAFLCALVSRVALALEGAFCIDAVAVSTQPDVLTLINVCFGGGKNTQSVKICNTQLILVTSSAPNGH